MSRVVRSNMASHCASSSQCSADSTTFRTITRLRGRGCEELTRPSRILSIVATQQGQGQRIRSGWRQPRGGAGEPRGGGELGAPQQQRDGPPPPPPQQPHLWGRETHPSWGESWRAWRAPVGTPGGVGGRSGSGAASRWVEEARLRVPGQVWASRLQQIVRRSRLSAESGGAVTEGAGISRVKETEATPFDPDFEVPANRK
uniref:Uncharacterized protein n=1 Tax=Theropithecus gelada TaxID=9565 RepID=A0A8D2F1C6_THEGE